MTTVSQYSDPEMPWRYRLMRIFLWCGVFFGGIALGAKLFDLLILAGAWSANPPASLALLPYGPRFPMNPGDFFQSLSLPMLVGILGAHLWMEDSVRVSCLVVDTVSNIYHFMGCYPRRVLAYEP